MYPTEDLEYIVQAQRIPGSDYRYLLLYNPFLNTSEYYFTSLDESNDVNMMGMGPFLTDETDFLSTPFERKCSFSSNVTASSAGSKELENDPQSAKKRSTLVINSKLSSQLWFRHER